MIRKMTPDDIDTVGGIWLEASIRAHHFVPEAFWRSDHETMTTEILPHPRTQGWVHLNEASDEIDGFVTLGGDTIACLFIRPDRQRRGVGSALLDHVKGLYPALELNVYVENVDATRFYEAQGFRVIGESTCKYTGCAELRMAWRDA